MAKTSEKKKPLGSGSEESPSLFQKVGSGLRTGCAKVGEQMEKALPAPRREKVDEFVTKAVPQSWLGTALAAATVLALLFFIMLVGFSGGEGGAEHFLFRFKWAPDLERGKPPTALKDKFKSEGGIILSLGAKIAQREDETWHLTSGEKIFRLEKENGQLNVYEPRAILQDQLSEEKDKLDELEGSNWELQKKLEKTSSQLEVLKKTQEKSTADLQAAAKAKKDADKELKVARKEAAKSGGLAAQVKKLKDQNKESNKKLASESSALRSAKRIASSESNKAGKLSAKLAKLEQEHKELKRNHDALEKRKSDEERSSAEARKAFESIVNHVKRMEPGKKVGALESWRDDASGKLAGTDYAVRLEKYIQDTKDALAKRELQAEKETKQKTEQERRKEYKATMLEFQLKDDYAEAMAFMERKKKAFAGTDYELKIHQAMKRHEVKHSKEVYTDTMKRRLVLAKDDHEEVMRILREAKQTLEGSKYEVSIQKEIDRRVAANKKRLYYEALKKASADKKAYAQNIEILEAALPQVSGTRYSDKLKTRIARTAYEEVVAEIKKAPTKFDGDVAAAEAAFAQCIDTVEAALPKTKGTSYEKSLNKRLVSLKADQPGAVGRTAYEAAVARLKESPKSHSTNVSALEKHREQASGSKWEAKINSLLEKEKKRLAKSRR